MASDEMTIQPAAQDDVEQIVRLVNTAYAMYLNRMEKPPAPMLADYATLIAHGEVYVLESGAEIAVLMVMDLVF